MTQDFKQQVIQIVTSIPSGEWISYGDVALLAGRPRAARAVSSILKREGDALPWHRVVAKGGRISIKEPELRRTQIQKLESEGLVISRSGAIM